MATALLIDDDVELIESVKRAAVAAQLDLVTATSWEEGLGLFHVLSPNLVVADYNMPGSRHGLMLLARIRRLRPSVRLLLVSGYLDEADLEKVRALNVVDRALTKGSVVETARAIVEEVREAQAQADAPSDWVAVAQAVVDAAAISDGELEQLDAILRKSAARRGAEE